ncbi:MAG TPA: serine/threonine-protein kinase [Streptosporangiaceae bacterium]|nr:serine/threonine-protein kinase [Streptosporangiaceae bacterium]
MEGLRHGDPASVGGYQLLGRLGAGGMGQVFLGISPSGRRVAVKLIHPVHAGTEHFRERFAREIEAARRVGGFHTAPVVDADPHAETPWMVTAYIDGPSLEEAVARHGPLPPGQVRALGAGLAEGLAAIHAHGLVHRDLKPGNVIMAEDGPRIIDFGIARAIGATALTTAGSVVGTFAYMSPEQVRGNPVLPVSDVFSLGSVLAFAATGRPPFGSDTAATVMFRIVSQPPDLGGLADQDLRTLIEACLAKSPADRPQLPAVLAALTGRGPVPAPVVPRTTPVAGGRDAQTRTHPGTNPPATSTPGPPVHARPAGRRPRRRTVTLIAAVAVLAVLGAVIPILLTSGSPGTPAGHDPGTGSSPGGAVAARDFTVQLPANAEANDLAFSPDGRFLAIGAENTGATYLWDVATDKQAAILKVRGSSSITSVAFSPDGKLLASANANGQVFLWDVPTGTLVATLTSPGSGEADGVAFSPDGTLLAIGQGNRQVYVWSVATRRVDRTFSAASNINGVAFSPDGQFLAGAGLPAIIWNVATGQRYAAFYDPHGQNAGNVAFSPDGKVLAVVDGNERTYLWDVASGNVIATLVVATHPFVLATYNESVAFSPDGKLLATGDSYSHVYLWNVATGKVVGSIIDPRQSGFWGVAFSPDGRLVAAANGDGTVWVRVVSQLVGPGG